MEEGRVGGGDPCPKRVDERDGYSGHVAKLLLVPTYKMCPAKRRARNGRKPDSRTVGTMCSLSTSTLQPSPEWGSSPESAYLTPKFQGSFPPSCYLTLSCDRLWETGTIFRHVALPDSPTACHLSGTSLNWAGLRPSPKQPGPVNEAPSQPAVLKLWVETPLANLSL